MKTRFDIDDSLIISKIEENYNIQVQGFDFLPKGDISYAYIITSTDGKKYFLKLFDKSTAIGIKSIKCLDFYLPLTWEMYHKGLYKYITYPIKNTNSNFQVDIGPAIITLFNYIEGNTLEDEYPFSRVLLEKVAKGIARIHKVDYKSSSKNAKIENFEIPFEEDLKRILDDLEDITEPKNQDIRHLIEYIIPRKNKVLDFLRQLHVYQNEIKRSLKKMVLTHGDIWGGNLILDSDNNLYIIDWESAMIAPPEADLRHYLLEDFEYFIEKYKEEFEEPVALDSNMLGFYVYRSHLANLTNWLSRILYNNQSSEQNKSDFECITLHCMDRWDMVEEKMEDLLS